MKSGSAYEEEELLTELEKSNTRLREENKALKARLEQLLVSTPNREEPTETEKPTGKVEDTF